MTHDDKAPGADDPDTSTDAGEDLEIEVGTDTAGFGETIPAAPAVSDEPAPPQDVRMVPARTFPQHFSLLLASAMILAGAFSVWHRIPPFQRVMTGTMMISGTLLAALALYSMIVSILNVLQGRLRGMGSAFVMGVLAFYFGFKNIMLTMSQEGVEVTIPDGTPEGTTKTIGGFVGSYSDMPAETIQDQVSGWIGQFGPGVLLTFSAGIIILIVFVKAMLPAKQAAPAPAARGAGSRRRRR